MPFYGPPSVLRTASVLAAVAVTLGVGVYANFTKSTPTGESSGRYIQCWRSSSGSALCVTETGTLSGTNINLASSPITLPDTDALYQEKTAFSGALLGSGSVIKPLPILLSTGNQAATTGTTIVNFVNGAFSGHIIGAILTATVGNSGATVDINLGGDSMFTTRITLDEDETSSLTALTPYSINSNANGWSPTEAMTIDIDSCGDTSQGATCPTNLNITPVFKIESSIY